VKAKSVPVSRNFPTGTGKQKSEQAAFWPKFQWQLSHYKRGVLVLQHSIQCHSKHHNKIWRITSCTSVFYVGSHKPQPQNMETSEDEIILHRHINYVLNPLPTHKEHSQCS
jgi:hypothetical protein